MLIVGPNFRVVLRLRGGVVAEAARPVSYMKGWRVERVLALAERWGWKAEMSDGERAQVAQAAQAPQSPRPAPRRQQLAMASASSASGAQH